MHERKQTMPFPSEAMKLWCQNVEKLREALFRQDKAQDDGWCQCQIGEAFSIFCPRDKQAQLCSGLFWSVWIDQVLFTVLPRELYDQFRSIYTFPKLRSHPTGHASPAFLINPPAAADERCQYQRPTRELLMQDKKEFWGEVAAWLRHVGQVNHCDAAEADFKADLGRRFTEEYHFLW
jgi:hypothetical protein